MITVTNDSDKLPQPPTPSPIFSQGAGSREQDIRLKDLVEKGQ